jgi:SET domain-containing protein
VSGHHLQGNTSLVVSKNPSTSSSLISCASESEGKDLEYQKTGLKSWLQSKKEEKLKRYQTIHKKKKDM